MKATIAWKHGHAFTSTYEGQTINIDGDKQEGPGPKSLLLSGLAGCSGIDVVDILEKMRVPFGRASLSKWKRNKPKSILKCLKT